MERIYFDNAATTALAPEVFEAMKPYFMEKFGNPSSIHSYGREVRLAIENARKSVASIISARPSDIIFTSGGTESTNTALHAAVEGLGCKTIITSPIEHHATLHTADYLQKSGKATVRYVRLDNHGGIDLNDLEKLLQESTGRCVVTLMHGNNETGFVTDIEVVGLLCERYNALFHSDIVQTLAHYPIDV
ncbi:MAG TPA: aminotransferase class V-fold PLP-dependent enzyme, partial [Ginsengibacter sp.]|nr:aminotransferase class V-fold PLP-dependent enzyme [Ginsengibacter sp.]